ncbi:uncharacterized protein LOC129884004 [Solanum dulcamara]|uniref:uncharacterized protein LOC129884004 n=1 Tax=Solanum dulcamara TaxID=45834 RepID=UPI002485C837|nr:uncharacterized protein LOC129884004 [Solanum dulcamara]
MPCPWDVSICINDLSIGFFWSIYPGYGDDKNRGDIGYAIAFDNWGRGLLRRYSTIPRVFNDFRGIAKLQAYAVLENKASHRVLEKAVFLYQGSVTKHVNIKKIGNMLDLLIYSGDDHPRYAQANFDRHSKTSRKFQSAALDLSLNLAISI